MLVTPAHAARSDSGSRRSPTTTSSTGGPSSGSGRRTKARTDTPSRPASDRRHLAPELTRHPDHEHLHGSESLADTVVSVRLPRPGPGIGHDLTVRQELACALRILAREGWRENLSGHITVATDDGGMWCNPWGIWWEEVRASDILRLDADGEIVEGPWDVTPGRLPPHRAAPGPRRRGGRRAQPPVLRDAARDDGRARRRWCTRTRASSTASSRSSTSTAASRTRTTGKWLAAAGRRRERHPARAPRRDRHRADDRGGVLQGHHVRAHVPVHLRHARRRPRARRRSRPTRAPRSSRCCGRTPRRRTGTAPSACCCATNPRCST